jgi:hypothetical protein
MSEIDLAEYTGAEFTEGYDMTPHQWLEALRDAPEGYVLNDLLDGFVRSQEVTVRRVTVDLTNVFRLDRTTHFDDVQSLVYETIIDLVREVREGDTDLTEFDSVSGVLRFRAKSKVRRWIDSSSGQNTASMQVNLKRRIWEMRQTRGDLFADLGREPSMHEVLDATNARLAKNRKNPKRQGMICSETDYAIMVGGPAASLEDVAETSVADPNETDSALHSSERSTLINMTIKACHDAHPDTGRVAEVFFAPALTEDYDGHPSSSEIASETGIPASTVRRRVEEVKTIAKRVLFDHFGIAGVDGAVEEA